MPREKNPENSAASETRAAQTRCRHRASAATPHFVGPEHRAALIARAAYFRAEQRGFAPGHELEDWLAAEAEVDAELLRGTAGRPRV